MSPANQLQLMHWVASGEGSEEMDRGWNESVSLSIAGNEDLFEGFNSASTLQTTPAQHPVVVDYDWPRV